MKSFQSYAGKLQVRKVWHDFKSPVLLIWLIIYIYIYIQIRALVADDTDSDIIS